jgi:hypothetical protein
MLYYSQGGLLLLCPPAAGEVLPAGPAAATSATSAVRLPETIDVSVVVAIVQQPAGPSAAACVAPGLLHPTALAAATFVAAGVPLPSVKLAAASAVGAAVLTLGFTVAPPGLTPKN